MVALAKPFSRKTSRAASRSAWRRSGSERRPLLRAVLSGFSKMSVGICLLLIPRRAIMYCPGRYFQAHVQAAVGWRVGRFCLSYKYHSRNNALVFVLTPTDMHE